jgi:lipoate---protein ligase
MFFVDPEGATDPHINLAIEEHILRNMDNRDGGVFLYINEPSIIIGRNQNPFEEVNLEFAEAHHLHIVRRLSGGGTVYHDLGNLNFSFITNQRKEDFRNFRKFTSPVIRVLRSLGVDAQLSERNDILVEGRKVSGNAQYIAAGRMLTHGTLLFNSELNNLAQALKVDASAFDSKSIKSVRSRVANISEFLVEPLDIETFRRRLLKGISGGAEALQWYRLTQDDWASIEQISAQRYRAWEWNFGHSPPFSLQKTRRFAWGEFKVQLEIANGMIQSIQMVGENFTVNGTSGIEKALTGVRYEREHMRAALAELCAGEDSRATAAGELARSLADWLI